MNSSYCLNMSLCNNHENNVNETNISFYNILLNACAKPKAKALVQLIIMYLHTYFGQLLSDLDAGFTTK